MIYRPVPIRRARLAVLVAVVAAATAAAVVHAGPALAASAFTSTIVNQGNGNCADVPGGGSANGAQLIQWTCNNGGNQSFAFAPVSGATDTYTIGTVTGGSCVDVYGASGADNAQIVQWTCNGQTNQRFRLQASGTGYALVSVASGKCVAPTGDASGSNTSLVQLPCTGAASRVWRLAGLSGGGNPPPTGDPWNPPANLVQPLAAVWSHEEQTYSDLYGFRNYGWDQIMAGRGAINYCVRWDSSAHVTAAQRDAVAAALQRQYQKWMNQMLDNGAGWNNWPYKQVPVKVVGWAVRDRSQLEWSDNSVDIYVGNIRENAPQCGEPCGRFFHQDGNYSGCPGGASHHYDHSLWLTAGFGGGAGGDWGQRIGSEYFMSNLNSDNIHILLHEMGHTYGLDDFYDWDPLPGQGFIMKAGSATQITDFDKWMLRDFWRHLKNRYGL